MAKRINCLEPPAPLSLTRSSAAMLINSRSLLQRAQEEPVQFRRLVDLHPMRCAGDLLVSERSLHDVLRSGHPALQEVGIAVAPDAQHGNRHRLDARRCWLATGRPVP